MSNKEKPHKKLNWKCSKCKERYNLEELEELGYVERIGNSMVSNLMILLAIRLHCRFGWSSIK